MSNILVGTRLTLGLGVVLTEELDSLLAPSHTLYSFLSVPEYLNGYASPLLPIIILLTNTHPSSDIFTFPDQTAMFLPYSFPRTHKHFPLSVISL